MTQVARTNGERFVDAYNRIDSVLRRDVKVDGRRPAFSELVRKTRRIVGRQQDFLLACGALRNVIVHERDSSTRDPIADPRTSIVEQLERSADKLEHPPRVIDVLKLQPPRVLNAGDDVGEFLTEIVEHDFSQVLVRSDAESLELVTTNALARWFAVNYRAGDGIVAESVTLDVIHQHAETGDALRVCNRGLTVVDAWQAFAGVRGNGNVPVAIVLTQSGKPDEKPLGICVRADLPAMLASLE